MKALTVHPRLLLALLLVLAASLRLASVARAHLWLDELWTLELSTGRGTAHKALPHDRFIDDPSSLTALDDHLPWTAVWGSLDEVTHPPLFFLLLRLWRTLFGDAELAIRALPCLASLGAVGLLFRAVQLLHGSAAALWAATVMSLSGVQLYYAQEARSYSLLLLLSLAALVTLLQIERRGATWGRCLTWGLLLFALLMTHYFTAGTVIGLGLYAGIRLRGRERSVTLLGLTAAGILFVLLWGPTMWAQRPVFGTGPEAQDWLREPDAGRLGRVAARVARLPAQQLAPEWSGLPRSSWFAALTLLVVVAPVAYRERRREIAAWGCWLLGTVGVVLLLDLLRSTTHLDYSRYTLLSCPALFALIGASCHGKTVARHLLPAAITLACILQLPDSLAAVARKPDWQPVAETVSELLQRDEIVAFIGDGYETSKLYLYVSHYLGGLPASAILLTQPPDADTLRRLHAAPGLCFVSHGDTSPHDLLPGIRTEQVSVAPRRAVIGRARWTER